MIEKIPKKMVAICMGQSNAANHGDIKMVAPNAVKVLKGLELVRASDPLPGASGDGGSVWTRLGSKLIARDVCDEVVFIPIAVDGAAVADWSPNGKYFQVFLDACVRAHHAELEVTHVFWHQGEKDTALRSGYGYYLGHLTKIVSSIGFELPFAQIIVCVASYRLGELNEDVRLAQKKMAEKKGVICGPDTDNIGRQWRYDDLHFNEEGQQKFSDLLFECVD
ncbi:MAG: sialate O-acetylesterase [Cocleimonas sp.]